jgi:hypothetical protein
MLAGGATYPEVVRGLDQERWIEPYILRQFLVATLPKHLSGEQAFWP